MDDAWVAAAMATAADLAVAAGEIARRHFRAAPAVENKQAGTGFDPVTRADLDIESFLRAGLAARHPALDVVGEEYGGSPTGGDYWIIDPIDGTRAFISGMLGWGILIGLVRNGRAVGGLLHQPHTNETFIADPLHGARLLHAGAVHPLRGNRHATLDEAILYSTGPDTLAAPGLAPRFHALAAHCRMQRWGGDCYGFAMVAQGSIDLMVEGGLAPHDIVPLVALIEQAGGIVTTWDGLPPLSGGNIIAAANPTLHHAALKALNPT